MQTPKNKVALNRVKGNIGIGTGNPWDQTNVFSAQPQQIFEHGDPQSIDLFPSANAAPGTPNKSITTEPSPQGFDLGGMLGGIAGGIGNAFKDPALISMAVGTGLGLASGQLSPIQSLGAGAQGAQGILNQQREDELNLRNKQWQMQLARAQGGKPTSIEDYLKQGQMLGLKGDQLSQYAQGMISGKAFTGVEKKGLALLGGNYFAPTFAQ